MREGRENRARLDEPGSPLSCAILQRRTRFSVANSPGTQAILLHRHTQRLIKANIKEESVYKVTLVGKLAAIGDFVENRTIEKLPTVTIGRESATVTVFFTACTVNPYFDISTVAFPFARNLSLANTFSPSAGIPLVQH